MVYDWEDKEDVCYRMYIEEKKSLEEIMDYMKTELKFAPSKRAFQTQFKRWDFPSKQHPAHKNAALVQRVKQLWDCNTSQRDMLKTLNDEGFDIKERELMRVRAKNRWLLRVPNGMKSKKSANSDQEIVDQLQAALFSTEQLADEDGADHQMDDSSMQAQTKRPPRPRERDPSPPLSPEVMQKRQERLSKLQAESAERWATRKRRRRTRGWAGLPADPPGPPRFPSETTIDESKAFLSLDSRLYRDIRARFQRICEEADILKKTIAGPERWEAAKDRLVQESSHLQHIFWTNEDNQEAKKLSLDVICGDVTKRMRTLERRMTIAEAKNALGVNPEESRQLRNGFYQTLKADHFTSKLEAGEEHWKELKQSWINGSDLLQRILAPGDADPQHQQKIKAMEVLCRDVMKRLRDDQTKRDPTRKKKFDSTFNAEAGDDYSLPEPMQEMVHQPLSRSTSHMTDAQKMSLLNPISFESPSEDSMYRQNAHQNLIQTATRAQAQASQSQTRAQGRGGLIQTQQSPPAHVMLDQIDPTLLLAGAAAVHDPTLMNHSMQNQFNNHQYADQPYNNHSGHVAYSPSQSTRAVYFRLHPASSQVLPTARLWVGMLTEHTVVHLREAAVEKFPGYYATRVEGIITKSNGEDLPLAVDTDDELEAYLATNEAKPTFLVQLVAGY